jgi:hypothetical protein
MISRPPAAYALGVIAASLILAGCSIGGNSQLAPSEIQNNDLASTPVKSTLAQLTSVVSPRTKLQLRHVTGTHPIKPDCCAYTKTLFVSDSGTNEVQMYDFPSNTYIGELSPPPGNVFAEPQGLCSDNKGDVYVTNTDTESIFEFSHNGTFLQALNDFGWYPVACSFDRSTGNLAVSNIETTADGPGSIAIYTHASGFPSIISGPGVQRFYFLAYAGKTGVLYFDGESESYSTVFGSFKNGKVKLITIRGATVQFPGTVAWSAQTQSMNIGDQDNPVLYQISPTGVITGSTPLTGSSGILEGTIKGPRFIGTDAGDADVKIFAYPAGGNPQSTLTGLSKPVGSAVSPDVPDNSDPSD